MCPKAYNNTISIDKSQNKWASILQIYISKVIRNKQIPYWNGIEEAGQRNAVVYRLTRASSYGEKMRTYRVRMHSYNAYQLAFIFAHKSKSLFSSILIVSSVISFA